MNKVSILKVAGIVILSFVVIVVVTFFLYPYLNEEAYEEIQQQRLLKSPDSASDQSTSTAASNISGGGQFDYLQQELRRKSDQEKIWEIRFDSLVAVNEKLANERDSVLAEINFLKESLDSIEQRTEEYTVEIQNTAGNNEPEMIAAADEPQEAFSERVKSMLNLDEEELEPIANQMSHNELVKIYHNSSNMQREKLLRSLTPERAAKLMREVML